jgi:5-methylcytosine-specific restriction endonuclease McrA
MTKGEKNKAQRKISNAKRKERDPIRYKAWTFTDHIEWGVGGTDRMNVFLLEFIGKPCIYCGVILDVLNCSLDHKIPLIRNRLKHRAKNSFNKLSQYTPEEVKKLNQIDNLHIICKRCNGIKSDIPHVGFIKLMRFLDTEPELKILVVNRLRRSNLMWGRLA